MTPADIASAVSLRFDIRGDQLIGRNATRLYFRPRQVAMYLTREMTSLSFPQIGRFYQRDHTTVMWACRKIKAQMARDGDIREAIESCRDRAKILADHRAERRRESLSKFLVEVRAA